MRSRAVSLPALCSRSRRSGPPPASASSEGESFEAKMRTARCVASQTVPSSSTTPRSSSAPMAAARWSGDSSAVTYSVAWTRINIAPRVIATIRTVVKTEARIIFMRRDSGRPEAAWRSIAQPERKQNAEGGELAEDQIAHALPGSAQTRPIVGDEDGIAGIRGVVLDARGLAGDKTLQANLAFEAGDVLRRVIGNAGNQVAVGDEMTWPHIFKRARAGSKQTLARFL